MTSTIRDVAKKAAVGVGTVSRVLNGGKNVRESTRERVLEAIQELDYSPNPIARRLSLGKTLTIGALVPTFTRPSFVERLRGVVTTLDESEYDLIIYNVETPEQRDSYFNQRSFGDRVDGLVIISLAPSNEEAAHFVQSRVPTILIDTYHPLLSSVYIDDVKGGQLATQHLLDLGHRRIAFISDDLISPQSIVGNRSMQDRYKGYKEALAAADIPFRPEYHKQNVHARSAARDSTHELLTLDDRPTAIFATSDTQAIGALQAARERNLRVPEDLSIVGYDDIEAADYLQITTVRQSLTESGAVGGQMVLKALLEPDASPVHHELPTKLVVRSTTAPVQT